MDQFDRAQELDARYREQAMRLWRQGATSRDQQAATHCEDCGDEIPEGRRIAAPGCTRCRDCQQRQEKGQR